VTNNIAKLALLATLTLALTFAFSCSGGDNGGSTEQSYSYCITANGCLTGPFTASTCTGQLSNSCPNSSSSSSNAIIPSSSSKAVVPSSSSVAVQEYCVYMPQTTYSDAVGICGVIEPIGSAYNCKFGTKSDVCPNNRYGKAYEKMNMNLLNDCVNDCPVIDRMCRTCGGTWSSTGCSVKLKFCGVF